jgi:PilZ domain.
MEMELRSSRRVAVTFPVRLSSDSMIGQGTVINLSVPGCAIQTDLPVQPGDYLELHVMTPDQARPLIVTLAKVRWATLQKAGIEFIRVRRDDQGRIQRLIGQLLDESAVETRSDQRELTAA